MIKKISTSLVLGCFALISQVYAHALWIETNAVGKAGQKQEVKVFYGEYVENNPDSVKNWYSDVKDFTLWVVGPDKQKQQLTCTAGVNSFAAEWTPEKDGVYYLTITHNTKDLGGTTLYQFDAGAIVKVGAGNNELAPEADLSALIKAGNVHKVNKPLEITGLVKAKPEEKLRIEIVAPTGWKRELTTDTKGVASFVPEWPGKYMIEVTRFEKVAGVHYEKKYDAIWRGATLCVEVK